MSRLWHQTSKFVREAKTDRALYLKAISTRQGQRRQEVRDTLLSFSDIPLRDKQDSCVYIPKNHSVYWEYLEREGATSFVAPALSGIQAIYGLPKEFTRGWGYDQFTFPENTDFTPSERELSYRSTSDGCKIIYRIEPQP